MVAILSQLNVLSISEISGISISGKNNLMTMYMIIVGLWIVIYANMREIVAVPHVMHSYVNFEAGTRYLYWMVGK